MKRLVVAIAFAVIATLLPQAPASAAREPFRQGLAWAVHEDACSPGVKRCVWDGRHRGNGVGRSYILIKARGDFRVKRISHKRAHRLAVRFCQRPTVDCRH